MPTAFWLRGSIEEIRVSSRNLAKTAEPFADMDEPLGMWERKRLVTVAFTTLKSVVPMPMPIVRTSKAVSRN